MGYDAEIVGPRMNPDLTPELEREAAFFRKWGYLIVEDALTLRQVEQLRDALDETFDRRGEAFTHQLLEEDERFAFEIFPAGAFHETGQCREIFFRILCTPG